MSDQITNTNITIQSVEQKVSSNGKVFFKIKDENNLSYTLWQKKVDGTDQPAFVYLNSLGYGAAGTQVHVGFTSEQGEYEGKTVTFRKIIGMREPQASTVPVQNTSQTPQNNLQEVLALLKSIDTKMSFLMGKQENVTKQEVTAEDCLKAFDGEFVDDVPPLPEF